jgi:hypothetical protein
MTKTLSKLQGHGTIKHSPSHSPSLTATQQMTQTSDNEQYFGSIAQLLEPYDPMRGMDALPQSVHL